MSEALEKMFKEIEETKEKEVREVVAVCSCGCSTLVLTKFEWIDGSFDYTMSLYKEEFYNKQETILGLIFTRIKHTWFTLIGKEYELFNLSFESKDYELFKKNVNEL